MKRKMIKHHESRRIFRLDVRHSSSMHSAGLLGLVNDRAHQGEKNWIAHATSTHRKWGKSKNRLVVNKSVLPVTVRRRLSAKKRGKRQRKDSPEGSCSPAKKRRRLGRAIPLDSTRIGKPRRRKKELTPSGAKKSTTSSRGKGHWSQITRRRRTPQRRGRDRRGI